MQQVHQMFDMVWVRTSDGRHYGETHENFRQDFGKEIDALPQEITSREYEPGVRHALKKNNDVIDGGPMPWPLGDQILAIADHLHMRKKERDDRLEQERKAKAEAETIAQAEALRATMPGPYLKRPLREYIDELRATISALQADVDLIKAQLLK